MTLGVAPSSRATPDAPADAVPATTSHAGLSRWRGEYPLPISFWAAFALPSLLASLALAAVAAWTTQGGAALGPRALLDDLGPDAPTGAPSDPGRSPHRERRVPSP